MTLHFLRDDDLDATQRAEVLDAAESMKHDRFAYRHIADARTIAVLFDKPSTRTRISFATGISELGAFPLVIDRCSTQLERGEPVADTARMLDRQVAAIVWRTPLQADLETMASISRVPVINALSNEFHPCQLLADLLTIRERKGALAGVTLAYFGDIANNMAQSYLLACAGSGMHVRLAGPEGIAPSPAIVHRAEALAAQSGGSVTVLRDAKVAAYEADVLATDTWVSMGQNELDASGAGNLRPFAVDEALLDVAGEEAFVLHCLPAYRGREITGEVLDGARSAVWDQAENRLHVQKALLAYLLSA